MNHGNEAFLPPTPTTSSSLALSDHIRAGLNHQRPDQRLMFQQFQNNIHGAAGGEMSDFDRYSAFSAAHAVMAAAQNQRQHLAAQEAAAAAAVAAATSVAASTTAKRKHQEEIIEQNTVYFLANFCPFQDKIKKLFIKKND
jgi:hypothetical protein